MTELRLICGKSGSGKDFLCAKNKWKKVPSYTTRLKRKGEQEGIDHIYVNSNFDDRKMAYTYFNGNHYWATVEQVENEVYTAYIIDLKGIHFFLDKYHTYEVQRPIKIVYVFTPWYRRLYRMIKRDGGSSAVNRFRSDMKDFRGLEKFLKKIQPRITVEIVTN